MNLFLFGLLEAPYELLSTGLATDYQNYCRLQSRNSLNTLEQWISKRLARYFQSARKHRVHPKAWFAEGVTVESRTTWGIWGATVKLRIGHDLRRNLWRNMVYLHVFAMILAAQLCFINKLIETGGSTHKNGRSTTSLHPLFLMRGFGKII